MNLGKLTRPLTLITVLLFIIAAAVVIANSHDDQDQDQDLDQDQGIFRGPTYWLQPRSEQVAQVFDIRGIRYVELSIDNREFGGEDVPGPPRISCSQEKVCTDACAGDFTPCPDLENGWYRVMVLPADRPWGPNPIPLNMGPQLGQGYRCGDNEYNGLELCWDPQRISPDSVSNARDVWYPALKEAAGFTWVSKTRQANGFPEFVATCAVNLCQTNIEVNGARLEVTFDSRQLSQWGRFNTGLHDMAAHLVHAADLKKK